MKKKILSGIFAFALLSTVGFGVNKSMNSDVNLNDLALVNVEALASGESSGSYDCGNSCTGAYCGTFTANDTGVTYKVYYC